MNTNYFLPIPIWLFQPENLIYIVLIAVIGVLLVGFFLRFRNKHR